MPQAARVRSNLMGYRVPAARNYPRLYNPDLHPSENAMRISPLLHVSLLTVVLLPLGGCLFRSHPVESHISTAILKTASKQELVERINREATAIKTLNATVDIDAAIGGQRKGKVIEYQQVRGYILVRQPNMLRMIGLLPVVRNRAFDMVSNGQNFRLSIPPKNRFVIGRNDVILPSAQSLEKIRPHAILEAVLPPPIEPPNEIAALENNTHPEIDPNTHKQVDQPDYVLIVIRRSGSDWLLSRKIIFDREDLQPHRQLIYDNNGYIVSDITYSNFTDHSRILYPNNIHIWRPQEEYTIGLHMVKLQFNEPLSDEQFVLNQPPGSQLVRLDVPSSQATARTPASGTNPQ